ncbi:hypothetical protein ELR99_24730 [Salmonella enterica subsp. enterica serovar Newport]|nr:hypothetical protein [Salmonella enterica subsp. enterica serovar Newport]ECA5183200.1 hypothetical protein [Salmonella enterica subsp. enterica serovar Newport]EKF5698537.1 hypothetical protein [Salmonella enterica subsp. enterica serovar Newport]
MARASRIRRNLLFDIDVDELRGIVAQAGATQHQFRLAYSRALKRTASKMRMKALAELKTGLAPRKMDMLRKRLFSTHITRGNAMDEARFWFGLNAIKIKDLRGRIRGRRVRHHDLRDPVTGRFIKENRARRRRKASDPVFEPNGSFLSPAAYENGLVMRSRKGNRRTIFIKNPETGRVREAEAGIYARTMDYVEDVAFAECLEIFMKEFESDIRRRAKYGITVAPR